MLSIAKVKAMPGQINQRGKVNKNLRLQNSYVMYYSRRLKTVHDL